MKIPVLCTEQAQSLGRERLRRLDVADDRNAAESFRLLFEISPVPMWIVERTTLKFLDVNAAAVEHYGYTRDQFLGMTSLEIRPQYERSTTQATTSPGTAAKRTGSITRPTAPKSW